ncbi:MAG: hypothetical protein K2G03_04015, partial [Bacilli bacterium]|nr:hypothetical protein [Bacilli bacterium]
VHMLNAGIIINREQIELADHEIIPYIKSYIDSNLQVKEAYEKFLKGQIIVSDINYEEFAVRVLGWVIIKNITVNYPDGIEGLDKMSYLLAGYNLKKKNKYIKKNDRYVEYINPIEEEICKIGMHLVTSPQNELSFWYPKTANIGFKTPNTLITKFTDEELKIIKSTEFKNFDYDALTKRLKKEAIKQNFDLNRDMFMRFGCSSNKFFFGSCHLPDLEFLPNRLLAYFDGLYEKLEWRQSAELVLREFIKTNYYRRQIYHGMPLNTEFRVFFDFDTNELLGIYNYWDKETMIDNLHSRDDRMTFADTIPLLERDFKLLAPYLEEEAKKKLPAANLTGKWSIDFMYDGTNFVLIDMGLAECSYYYEKVIEKQLALQNK